MSLVNKLDRRYKAIRRGHFERLFFQEHGGELPGGLANAIHLLFGDDTSEEETNIRDTVERRREEIRSMDEGVPIYHSPSPDSDLEPGEVRINPSENIANNGLHETYGLFLRRVLEGRNLSNPLELGSCAGIGAGYLASASTCEQLTTVEASEGLAELARETISLVEDDFSVENTLFDEYLDEIEGSGVSFDFAFIDGHHEREATLHYYNLLHSHLPDGAIVVFDDIRWSRDMYNGWREIQDLPTASVSIDAGRLGLIVHRSVPSNSKHFDLTDYLGEPNITERWE